MREAKTRTDRESVNGARHAIGQYFTPAIVCDLICRLTIESPHATLLDPSCGDGQFLVAASSRLLQLGDGQSTTDKDFHHPQVFGIELDASAAAQAIARLEGSIHPQGMVRGLIIRGDFFDVKPGTRSFPRRVDAVIGNPPYIRQELIMEKRKVRAHLDEGAVDERADLYVYFFTLAAQWLDEGGLVGFLTSERYLDTQYGKSLQHFLLDRFKIRAVISFDKQIFSDALIGTVITILEKTQSDRDRHDHVARFMRVKRLMPIGEIEAALSGIQNETGVECHDAWDVVSVPQRALRGVTKWRPYLYAPPLFFELQQSTRLVELGTIATIKRGITSGANEFFYRREKDFESLASSYPGLKQYFKPLLKAIGQTDWTNVLPCDTDWFVLDVHHLVKKCLGDMSSSNRAGIGGHDVAGQVKERLSQGGHAVLVKYIEDAEYGRAPGSMAVPSPRSNATCTARAVWFDLGDLLAGGIGFPKEYWSKFICPLLHPGLAVDSRVYVVMPREWTGVDPRVDKRKVLAALLNADLSAMFYECQGRVYAGQALDRASCMVYEAGGLLVIDPRQLSTSSLFAIQSRMDALLVAERSLVPRKTRSSLFEAASGVDPAQRSKRLDYLRLRLALNEEILGTIGMKDKAIQLQASVQHLVEARRKRRWDDVQVLIEP